MLSAFSYLIITAIYQVFPASLRVLASEVNDCSVSWLFTTDRHGGSTGTSRGIACLHETESHWGLAGAGGCSRRQVSKVRRNLRDRGCSHPEPLLAIIVSWNT